MTSKHKEIIWLKYYEVDRCPLNWTKLELANWIPAWTVPRARNSMPCLRIRNGLECWRSTLRMTYLNDLFVTGSTTSGQLSSGHVVWTSLKTPTDHWRACEYQPIPCERHHSLLIIVPCSFWRAMCCRLKAACGVLKYLLCMLLFINFFLITTKGSTTQHQH